MSGLLTAHSPISTWITNSTYKLTMLQDGHPLTTDQATFQNTNVDLFSVKLRVKLMATRWGLFLYLRL